MLNAELDLDAIGARFSREGRVQIRDVLEQRVAQRLWQCLDQEVDWTVAYIGERGSMTMPASEFKAMDHRERSRFMRNLLRRSQNGFQFFYDSYMMVTAYKEGRDPGLLLHRVLETLNSPEFLTVIRHITGVDAIRKADAQATCYRPGHFLRHHDDSSPGEQRREVAYVLNLTRRWEPDWGGLLHFYDEDGNVVESVVPRFNTLSLFRVPARHFVSYVSPWAGEPRYAITGWFRSD